MSNQKVNSTGKKNARLDKSKKLITQYKKGKNKRKPDSVATSLVTLGQDTSLANRQSCESAAKKTRKNLQSVYSKKFLAVPVSSSQAACTQR